MTNKEKAAYTARNCQSNDIENHAEIIDFISEKILGISRIIVPAEIRIEVLAEVFSKCFVDECYTGDVFTDLEHATTMIGESIATHILDEDPSLYEDIDEDDPSDGCVPIEDSDMDSDEVPTDDDPDPFDELCGSGICEGCCEDCPIACACIPIFVSDGVEMRVVLRRRDDDA